MVVETHILGGNQRVDHIRRDVGIFHADTVLVAVVAAEQLHVGGDDLGGKLVLGILQLV